MKIKNKNDNKIKRKMSVITVFLWIFLVTIMVILVISGVNKSRALESTEEIPTIYFGNIRALFWSCRCEDANSWPTFDNIEDYCIIGDIVKMDNSKFSCIIKLNKDKINDMIDFYNTYYENDHGIHCYNPDADIKDEIKVYWNGEYWWGYYNSFVIPVKLYDLPPSPKNDVRYNNTVMSNIFGSKIKFECLNEPEDRYLSLNGFDFYKERFYKCFIVDNILENTEDKVVEGGIIPKEEIPYKCTIRINKNKINDIINIYNRHYENEYGKHYYYVNDNIFKFEETLYWQNHAWRQLNSLTVTGINSNTGRPIIKYNFNDIFTIPIREMTEVSKKVTLSYGANIDENEEKVEVPESNTQIVLDGESAIFEIPNMLPIRSGYKFLGWSNNNGKNMVDYNIGENIYLTENKTIYAVWEKISTDIHTKYGSYRIIHEYYTKDKDGNIILEDKVTSDVVTNIEVGKKIGMLENDTVDIEVNKELVHTVNGIEYKFEYLENSGNIVIEENVEKEIIIKYVRNISDEEDEKEDIVNDDINNSIGNVDTSDINIWLYVVVFIIAIVVIAVIIVYIIKKNK